MDYEKAYKELVQRARELHQAGGDLIKMQMEILCPELAKSGDERIRDEILTLVKNTVLPDATCLVRGGTTTRKEAEGYLGKLKDVKFLSWRSTDECGDIEDGHLVVVAYNRPGFFALDKVFKGKLSRPFIGCLKAISVFYIPNANEKCIYPEKQKEQTPKEDKDAIEPTPKQDYSGLTDFERAIHRGFLCAGVENVPVEIIKETAQDCLAQMKPAWNKEDEEMLTGIIERGSSQVPFGEPTLREEQMEWLMNRLKSLRPQSHWKPSAGQMYALNRASKNEYLTAKQYDILVSLHEQLKKL